MWSECGIDGAPRPSRLVAVEVRSRCSVAHASAHYRPVSDRRFIRRAAPSRFGIMPSEHRTALERGIVLSLLILAGGGGLLLGTVLDTGEVSGIAVGGLLAILLIPVGYAARDLNVDSGPNLGNPVFALATVLIVGVYVPVLVPWLVSIGLRIPDLVSPSFYVRFRLFGFSFVGAYLVEQLVLLFRSGPTRRDRFAAFVGRFGLTGGQSTRDRFAAFVAGAEFEEDRTAQGRFVAFVVGFGFALAVFGLQVRFGRSAGILPNLLVVLGYLELLRRGRI